MEEYRPGDYWDERLAIEHNLRGTGHLSYDERYNRWMYRRKGEVLARALQLVGPRQRALDIGSGVGWVMAQVLDAGAGTVDGVDISATVVDRLRATFPDSGIHCHALGTGSLPVPDASYELVTMMDVAYHITDDALFAAGIADLARVLAPGGTLIVTDGLGEHTSTPAPHVRFRPLGQWEDVGHAVDLRVTSTVPLYSWLSRDVHESRLRHLPDRLRGAVEYLGERIAPRTPHLRLATLTKAS